MRNSPVAVGRRWHGTALRGRGRERGRGLTILELAVSVAIVGVLVVALLPAVSNARTQALVVSCASNQHQLVIGYQNYINAYQQLPGQHWQEGVYWAQPWGQGSYGGVQAWMPRLPASPPTDFGLWGMVNGVAPSASDYSGIGYVYPFVGGDGTAFYCPGTVASFDHSPVPDDPDAPWGVEGYTFGEPWYSTWTGIDPPFGRYKFEEQGAGTLTTYYFRGGMWLKDANLPDDDPRWGSFAWTSPNWTTNTLQGPDSPYVQGKPALVCYWLGGWYTGWTYAGAARYDAIPHGGTGVNLMYTDGSSVSWTLPDTITARFTDGSTATLNMPVTAPWGWFDAGAHSVFTYDSSDFYKQMPAFWLLAEREAR